jgi:hypothetical protein
MPTCDRLDVLVDGSVGSNRPWVCECFLEWLFAELGVRGDDVRSGSLPDARAAAVDKLGREKF